MALERASDADRMAVLAVLRDHCAAGTITLNEFSDRCALALASTGRHDLDELTADLPRLSAAGDDDDAASGSSRVRVVAAVFGTNRLQARWRVGRRTTALAIFGAARVDLRHAQLGGGELTVWALPIFGTVKVVVPDGIGVDLAGVSIFGATADRTNVDETVGLAPVIRVRSLPLFGTVRVVSRSP